MVPHIRTLAGRPRRHPPPRNCVSARDTKVIHEEGYRAKLNKQQQQQVCFFFSVGRRRIHFCKHIRTHSCDPIGWRNGAIFLEDECVSMVCPLACLMVSRTWELNGYCWIIWDWARAGFKMRVFAPHMCKVVRPSDDDDDGGKHGTFAFYLVLFANHTPTYGRYCKRGENQSFGSSWRRSKEVMEGFQSHFMLISPTWKTTKRARFLPRWRPFPSQFAIFCHFPYCCRSCISHILLIIALFSLPLTCTISIVCSMYAMSFE